MSLGIVLIVERDILTVVSICRIWPSTCEVLVVAMLSFHLLLHTLYCFISSNPQQPFAATEFNNTLSAINYRNTQYSNTLFVSLLKYNKLSCSEDSNSRSDFYKRYVKSPEPNQSSLFSVIFPLLKASSALLKDLSFFLRECLNFKIITVDSCHPYFIFSPIRKENKFFIC